jgi:hypothetical protein
MLAISLLTKAQDPNTTDFYALIKNYDLSSQWKGDSIQLEGDGDMRKFPEPIGFIGDNYQRFYIHYVSVVKSGDYEYRVQGKTKVKNNICSFTGTITIVKAKMYKRGDDPSYKQGFATCRINLAEDSTQASAGFIKGELTTNFYFDKKHKLHYDALMFFTDGFCNNQCTATWTSYKTGKAKKCNWGDDRIPYSGDLDQGAGEFMVNDKYINAGWEPYMKCFSGNSEESKKAIAIENEKWWK